MEIYSLSALERASHYKYVVILKHSKRCGISAMAEDALRSDWSWKEEDVELYHLDLLSHRDLSNEIAHRFQIDHHSPQLLLIRNGKLEDSVTHHAVRPEIIERWLAKRIA